MSSDVKVSTPLLQKKGLKFDLKQDSFKVIKTLTLGTNTGYKTQVTFKCSCNDHHYYDMSIIRTFENKKSFSLKIHFIYLSTLIVKTYQMQCLQKY